MTTKPKMLCEVCMKPSQTVRLVKWEAWDTWQGKIVVKRLWLCLQCWTENGGTFENIEQQRRDNNVTRSLQSRA
jgi:hypothetical protein